MKMYSLLLNFLKRSFHSQLKGMNMRKKIENSNILVTGGAGFIGSHLVDGLVKRNAKKIVIMDNLFLGKEENIQSAIKDGCVFIKDDAEIFTSLEYIIESNQIDIVFNMATKALNYSFVNPRNSYETNTNIIMNLLELQRKGLFQTLCHCSTSEVYGTAVYEPMDENHPLKPTTLYAAGKAAADIALETYVRMYGLDSFIVRPFNNYGPRQNHEGYMAAVIPVTIKRILNNIDPVIFGTGEQKRDFIHVNDTVNAILEVYRHLKQGESVNICSDNQIKILELIRMIVEKMDYKGNIKYEKRRESDVDCHKGSNEKLLKMISFDQIPFTDGLQQTIEWYKDFFNK